MKTKFFVKLVFFLYCFGWVAFIFLAIIANDSSDFLKIATLCIGLLVCFIATLTMVMFLDMDLIFQLIDEKHYTDSKKQVQFVKTGTLEKVNVLNFEYDIIYKKPVKDDMIYDKNSKSIFQAFESHTKMHHWVLQNYK